MANVKYIVTTSDKVNEIVEEVGQVIFVEDSRRIALDGQDGRVFYDQIMCLAQDSMRTSMIRNLVDGFYFTLDTNILWRLDNLTWIQITEKPDSRVIYGTLASFPRPGMQGRIYMTDSHLYHWDPDSESYVDYCNAAIRWITENEE